MTFESHIKKPLAVIRLGDADRLGWWRSHSVDETAEYVLGGSLPTTWMATGLELAMESARLRQETALARPTAVHLFSDYLPVHRTLRSWLIERKLERDPQPLMWLRGASVDELYSLLGNRVRGERRASGVYLGDVTRQELDASADALLSRLIPAYADQRDDFLVPYLDLVD